MIIRLLIIFVLGSKLFASSSFVLQDFCNYECLKEFKEMSERQQRNYLDSLYIQGNTKRLKELMDSSLNTYLKEKNLDRFEKMKTLYELAYEYKIDKYTRYRHDETKAELEFKRLPLSQQLEGLRKNLTSDSKKETLGVYEQFMLIYEKEKKANLKSISTIAFSELVKGSLTDASSILSELMRDDVNIRYLLEDLSYEDREEVLCEVLDEDMISFEESNSEECRDFQDCVEGTKLKGEELLKKYERLELLGCHGSSLTSYINEFVDNNIEYSADFYDIDLEDHIQVNFDESDCDEQYEKNVLTMSLALPNNVLDILLKTKNCSFEQSAKDFPEFAKNKIKMGVSVLKEKEGVFYFNEGKDKSCNYYMKLIRNKKKTLNKEAKSLDEIYELLLLMYRGNTP